MRLGRSHIVTHGSPAAFGRSTIMDIRRAWNHGMIGRGEAVGKNVAPG
jgi:hypothetical protein